MKSLLLVYENASAEPMDELDGRTPLQVARCPHATRLAGEGLCGLLSRLPAGEGPRAEALLAGLLGVPRGDAWRLSRGALEAESAGADWQTFNYAYRADLVTLDQGVMRDAHLARLTLAESERLVASLQLELDALNVRIKPIQAGHAVVMMQQDDVRMETGFAPWLVADSDEAPRLEGKRARLAREVMEVAARVLARQTINDVRVDLGDNPATDLWLWAGGTPVEMLDKFGGRKLRGAMLTQSAMARGLGLRMGMTVESLAEPWLTAEATPAVTGETLARLWQDHDVVVVYVEAPATLLEGSAKDRVHLLERLDLLVTGPLLEAVKKIKHRRMVLATVPTAALPGSNRDELELPVVVWGAHVNPDPVARWDEVACAAGELSDVDATDVFGRLVGG